MFYYIYLIPIFLSALAGLRAFRYNWPGAYRRFAIFLAVVFFVEIFAVLWTDVLYKQFGSHYTKGNNWIYNPFMLAEYIFYLFFFVQAAPRKAVNRHFLWGIILVLVTGATINMVYGQGMIKYNSYSQIGYSLLMVYLTIHYYLHLLRSNTLINLAREPLVWICIGAFFYHLCCIPFYIFIDYTVDTNLGLAVNLYKIKIVLNWFMYSIYTIAFLCRKKFQP